jgi:hypothetical protein
VHEYWWGKVKDFLFSGDIPFAACWHGFLHLINDVIDGGLTQRALLQTIRCQ